VQIGPLRYRCVKIAEAIGATLFGCEQVFPMLGLFYSVVGVLQLVLDKYLARKGNLPTADLRKVVFSFM
jgi:hypothetical protein